ncbi:MAG: DUF1304 domain-containing protein [Bdellovibrionota bacterium]
MLSSVVAALIALIHIYVFALESLLWGKPISVKTFRVSGPDVEANRQFAFNQGFYNLFLALAIVIGIVLMIPGEAVSFIQGRTLVDYSVLSVFGAGAVLLYSSRRLLRAAMVQMVPAALYFLFRALDL